MATTKLRARHNSGALGPIPDGTRRLPLQGKAGKGLFTLVDEDTYHRFKGTALRCRQISTGLYAYAPGPADERRPSEVALHRLVNRTPSNKATDHISGDTLDNRRCNLRSASVQQNARNRTRRRDNRGRYKGVSATKGGKWTAAISVPERRYYLGTYEDDTMAAAAYDAAARKLFGEFARTNFEPPAVLLLAQPSDSTIEERDQFSRTCLTRRGIAKRLLSGESTKAIAQAEGVKKSKVRSFALDFGFRHRCSKPLDRGASDTLAKSIVLLNCGLSYQQVGEVLGVSRQRIDQIAWSLFKKGLFPMRGRGPL